MKKLLLIIIFYFCSFWISCSYASNEETLIIFDASVSMIDTFSGKPKYIIAVEETKKALDKIPDSNNIGLRTIGVSLDGALLSFIQNPDELCKATRLISPIKQYNINSIKNNLDTIFPLGTTPLTYTLDLAINYDFSNSASLKHIILVTDGAESCNGDPCSYIQKIMQSRNDIKIDIIAIGVNSEDFKQLKCLSDYTSGAIFNINNPDEMESAFKNVILPDKKNKVETYYKNSGSNDDVIYKNYSFETYY